ncbi:MAG: amidohydrolase family protein [Propionibacteriaceae bacterium]|jgi:N-acetylglucosamine-6-phosphate deacetylase|nr:amidohydrolase family protein [Propionibacteriaceae bacterium]
MIVAGRLLFDDGFATGWLEAADGRIVRVERGRFDGAPDLAVAGFVVPAFVDVHSHGAGGAAFTDGADAARTALAAHRAHGTAAMIASLVTATLPELLDQVAALGPLVDSGELAGIHLEGPWIAPEQKGAHDPDKLSAPLDEAVDAIAALPPGWVRMVTIAPELENGYEAIRRFHEAGIVVAVGHTACDYDGAKRAFEDGASGVTHLFNAMPDLLKRRPGPVLAAWQSQAWMELIFDGHHVDAALASFVCREFPQRLVLITDAMAAACLGDGDYTLGGLPVRVTGGVARIVETGALAGSTITLADAVANAVASGVELAQAVRFATANPADYLSIPGVGRLAPGNRADLLELDERGRLLAVL